MELRDLSEGESGLADVDALQKGRRELSGGGLDAVYDFVLVIEKEECEMLVEVGGIQSAVFVQHGVSGCKKEAREGEGRWGGDTGKECWKGDLEGVVDGWRGGQGNGCDLVARYCFVYFCYGGREGGFGHDLMP